MNETISSSSLQIELPATAPLVRISAGIGSATQKTWNLRRPVTLIGTKRPAHIVLHDREVSNAHCVIINTGTDVLLKDLHTGAGTLLNKYAVDLSPLSDGDVITVGGTKIQVAIQVSPGATGDSGCGVTFDDPTSFPKPVTVSLMHTDTEWTVTDAATLIGRHEAAPIRLQHDDVGQRHALLFRFSDRLALFDLGGPGGVLVNGCAATCAPLSNKDRVTIGPFGLQIAAQGASSRGSGEKVDTASSPTPSTTQASDTNAAAVHTTGPEAKDASRLGPGSTSIDEIERISADLDTLRKSIAESWDHLNAWPPKESGNAGLRADRTNADGRPNGPESTRTADADDRAAARQSRDLSEKEAELDARDAALRGRLHDVSVFQEAVMERERELEAQLAKLAEQRAAVEAGAEENVRRAAEVERRAEELARREHVFAQRWSRLRTATCGHCGKPFSNGDAASS